MSENKHTTLGQMKDFAQRQDTRDDVQEEQLAQHKEAIESNVNDLTDHTGNNTVHITSAERINWNAAKTHADSKHAPVAAEENQNAISNVIVGNTTIAADSKTASLTLEGSNVTLTPDATNDKVTIGITKNNVVAALGYTPPTANTTYSVVSTTANGLAPKRDGNTASFLRGDGVWATPPDTDTVYTHPTTAGNKHIPAGGENGQILRWSSDGTAAWGEDKDTVYTHPTYTARTGVPTANATPGFGGTFTVSQPVSDTAGHITAVNSRTITIPKTEASTSAAGLMSVSDKEKLNVTNVAYGTCETAADTAAKVVTINGNDNWKLAAGSVISVKFSYTNTASNPTLNVNGTGAKSVWYNTALITTSNLSYAGYASRVAMYMYDGAQYVFQGWSLDNNSDTKVTQTVRTTNGEFPVLLRGTSAGTTTTTTTTTFGTKVTVNPSTGKITASGGFGGNADSATIANKINTDAGSATNPVYFEDGVPVKTTYTLESSVPSGAKFTDTVYTHPSYTARTGVPTANQTPAFGGTFTVSQPVSDATGHITAVNSRTITIPKTEASTSAAGLMSAADKTTVDTIQTGILDELDGVASGGLVTADSILSQIMNVCSITDRCFRIWSNLSPTSTFAATSVTNASDYNYFIVAFRRSTSNARKNYIVFPNATDIIDGFVMNVSGTSITFARRQLSYNATNGTFAFGDCYTEGSSTVDNTLCIPTEIYGIY